MSLNTSIVFTEKFWWEKPGSGLNLKLMGFGVLGREEHKGHLNKYTSSYWKTLFYYIIFCAFDYYLIYYNEN